MKKVNFVTKRALILALGSLTFFAASAADIYVSSEGSDDSGDGSPQAPVATLAAAYQRMNNQEGLIYVSGVVPANTTGNGLEVTINITVEGIDGTGAGITGDSIRLFYVRNNAVLTLKNLHLSGNPEKSLVGQGGCIHVITGGALFVENVTFENFSTAINPLHDPDNGGNQNSDNSGAGVIFLNQFNAGSANPVLSFKNCLFKNNFTTGNWGGGVIRIQDFGNVTNPHVYFENCGFYGNRTKRGNPGGSIIVIRNGSAAASQISFVNSTITACGEGGSGAIAFSSANIALNVINTTIKDNPISGIICWEQSNSTFNIHNSVIENNAGLNMNDMRFSEKAGTELDSAKIRVSNSLIENPLWRNVPAEKIPYIKPADYTVNTLFDNLDPTTISFTPKSGSLAIDYGDKQYLEALGINYDQLNATRAFTSGRCDAGAVEFDKIPPLIDPVAANDTVEYNTETNPEEFEAWLDSNGGAVATDASDVTWTNDFDEDNWIAGDGNEKHISVTFTATDINGNSAAASAIFAIEDTTAPVITTEAAGATVKYNAETNPEELTEWLDSNGGADATDASAITWTNDFDEDNWVADGGNAKHIDVTFTVTDLSGNYAATSATFTVTDLTGISKPSPANALNISREGEKLIIRTRGQAGESALISLSGQTLSKGFGNEISIAAAGNGVYILSVEIDGEKTHHKTIITK